MARTIRETYFDPDYKEIKYINEHTTLYALKHHGLITEKLANRLCSFSNVGDLIDTPMEEIMKLHQFGIGFKKELISFFKDNHNKFRLKAHKPTPKKTQDKIDALEKKIIKYQDALHSHMNENFNLQNALETCNLDLTAYKGLESVLFKDNEALKKETQLAKDDYDNYYKESIKDFNEKIKIKDIKIESLQQTLNQAYEKIQLIDDKYTTIKNKHIES